MHLRGQFNLHLGAFDQGVSETREHDETRYQKNIDVLLREVQCLRSRAVGRILISGAYMYIYADPTRILWRICRGDSIRKAVRPGV